MFMWKLAFVIAYLFVEGVGIPLASETSFFVLGNLVVAGIVPLPVAFLAAWMATSLGNLIGYIAFHYYGLGLFKWLGRRWPAFDRKRLDLEPKFRTNWMQITLIARFLGFGSPQLVLWVAGSLRLQPFRFLTFLFVINLFWTAYWLSINRWFARFFFPFWRQLDRPEKVVTAAALLVALWLSHRLFRLFRQMYGNWRRKRGEGKG